MVDNMKILKCKHHCFPITINLKLLELACSGLLAQSGNLCSQNIGCNSKDINSSKLPTSNVLTLKNSFYMLHAYNHCNLVVTNTQNQIYTDRNWGVESCFAKRADCILSFSLRFDLSATGYSGNSQREVTAQLLNQVKQHSAPNMLHPLTSESYRQEQTNKGQI